MGAAAVRAARAIGYVGAGTVEFIADGARGLRSDGFWFMEMNTRLQVEHPVTEAVTGVDLVEWQLRVARGEPLPRAQDEIRLSGHAIEARLYAEDATAGFLPATGRLAHLRFPEGVRVDAGVRGGDEISPHYDPMIAKVIAHGPDRPTARARLEQALSRTEVAGTVTNIAFLTRLVAQENFVAGDVDTGLIARHAAGLCDDGRPAPRAVARAALVAAGLETALPFEGVALWAPLARRIALERGGEAHEAVLEMTGPGRARLSVGGATVSAERRCGTWWLDGRPAPVAIRHETSVTVFEGGTWRFDIPDPLARGMSAHAGGDAVEAPMPGVVRELRVAKDDLVEAGARLVVLEAMKMEHALVAPRAGRVSAVHVRAGDQVAAGAALVELAEAEAEDTDAPAQAAP
jgi:3-methylcrotonyl-CoA carboxylase alpha subunit